MSENNNVIINESGGGKTEMNKEENKSSIIIINNEKFKKKFRDTKFAKFVSDHSGGILSVAIGLGTGAGLSIYAYKSMKKMFNCGFWSGYVFGGSDVVSTISKTEPGKEALAAAYGESSVEVLTHHAEKVSSAFDKHVSTYDLSSTVDFSLGLVFPAGKKLR